MTVSSQGKVVPRESILEASSQIKYFPGRFRTYQLLFFNAVAFCLIKANKIKLCIKFKRISLR